MYVNQSGREVTRKRIKEWVTVFEDKSGNRITIRGFKKPTKHRVFRVSAKPGRRKFKAISVKYTTKEVIIVAKKKKAEAELSEEDLEELEELEDLDDLDEEEDEVDEDEDEDVDEDEDDEDSDDEDEDEDDSDEDDDESEDEDEDDEDDEDEDDDEEDEDEEPEPPKKKSKKSKSKKSKSKKKSGKSRAAESGKVGTQEVAAHCGIDGRVLRQVLRKHNIPKDPDTKRYEWSSLKHPEVKKIVKLIKERGEHKKVTKESLDNLKKGRKKSKSKASSKGKSTKKKRTKRKKSSE